MNLSEFRSEMNTYWQSVNSEANQRKDSYFALEKLFSLYRSFDGKEKEMANLVIEEWLSDREVLRFDALALIDEFKIRSAIDSIYRLKKKLESSDEPTAPYERKKAQRIIDDLQNNRNP